jgi:hypothetical protein
MYQFQEANGLIQQTEGQQNDNDDVGEITTTTVMMVIKMKTIGFPRRFHPGLAETTMDLMSMTTEVDADRRDNSHPNGHLLVFWMYSLEWTEMNWNTKKTCTMRKWGLDRPDHQGDDKGHPGTLDVGKVLVGQDMPIATTLITSRHQLQTSTRRQMLSKMIREREATEPGSQ